MSEIHLTLAFITSEDDADVTVRGEDAAEFLEYIDHSTLLQRVLKDEAEDCPFDSVEVEPRSGLEGFSDE